MTKFEKSAWQSPELNSLSPFATLSSDKSAKSRLPTASKDLIITFEEADKRNIGCPFFVNYNSH